MVLPLVGLVACTPPVRQFDIKDQAMTCEQANEAAYRTLESMSFIVSSFEPAVIGRIGTLRGVRDNHGSEQQVTVKVACDGKTADIDASEDGKWLGQLEFKRGFFLSFSATRAQAAINAASAREEAQRPLEQKRMKGLQVLVEPVRGQGSKLDFGLDLAAAGVLPVHITITNSTTRTYRLDPGDIALAQKDGTRVRPLPVDATVQRVADSAPQAPGSETSAPSRHDVQRRLEEHLLSVRSVSPNQTYTGYLYYPLASYLKARISFEDVETEETEGFVVEF